MKNWNRSKYLGTWVRVGLVIFSVQISVIFSPNLNLLTPIFTKNHNNKHKRDVGYWITITITDRLWWLWLFGFGGYSGSIMGG
ncbi:hypothetical protein Hanom_Chr12g01122331 [Helianthus anomalus]